MIKKYQFGNGCASVELFEAGINVGATIRKRSARIQRAKFDFLSASDEEEPGQT